MVVIQFILYYSRIFLFYKRIFTDVFLKTLLTFSQNLKNKNMKAENKKYLVYGGIAFLVGSLGYFVYTTLKNKNANIAENETVIFSEKEPAPDTNPFKDMLDNPVIPSQIDWSWSGSKLPNIDNIFSQGIK